MVVVRCACGVGLGLTEPIHRHRFAERSRLAESVERHLERFGSVRRTETKSTLGRHVRVDIPDEAPLSHTLELRLQVLHNRTDARRMLEIAACSLLEWTATDDVGATDLLRGHRGSALETVAALATFDTTQCSIE